MKHLATIILFTLLFATMIIIEPGHVLGLYGLVLLLYLLAKMLLSIIYKPITGEPKQFRVDAVIPSFNEKPQDLIQTIESVLTQTYPINKVYVIDDGSPNQDGFQEVLNWVNQHPNRNKIVAHSLEKNAGKRHAQAWAFKQSDADVFFTVDSDSYIYPNALEELIKCFNDDEVYAATGHINARNRDENFLTRLIDIRYDNAFRVERAAQSVTGNILTCSGPLAVYRREVVIPNLDHYLNQWFLGVRMTMGDDRCLTNYANKLGKTKYQSTARCDTDVPNNLKQFLKQQIRWNKSFYRESLIALKMVLRRPVVSIWSFTELLLFVLLNISVFRLFTSSNINFSYILMALAGIILSALVRNVHYAIKHPLLFLLSPFYGILHILLLQPIRLWALLTIKDVGWGTRVQK